MYKKMELEEKLDVISQTEIIVIPIIDASGTISGEKMAALNSAMAEIVDALTEIQNDFVNNNRLVKLLIAPMDISCGARWFALKNNRPVDIESFRWIDMKANGLSDLGAAFKLLTEKLTTEDKGGWMKGRGGAAPVLILISDGGPTDDYQTQLQALKNRGWFNAALKFAVAVEGADKTVLTEFTGNSEAVIDTTVIRNDLASIVKMVVATAGSGCGNRNDLVLGRGIQRFKYIHSVRNNNSFIAKDDQGEIIVVEYKQSQFFVNNKYSQEDLIELSKILSNEDNHINYVFKGDNKELLVLWRSSCDDKMHCQQIKLATNFGMLDLVLDSTDDLF